MRADEPAPGNTAATVDPPLAARTRVLVGLMSGTSLDGVSAVVVRFRADEGGLSHELLAFTVSEYTGEQRARLAAAIAGASPAEYCRLGFDVGEWLADAALKALALAGVARTDISAIASHGQTLWHEPGHSTWQVGEAAVIAERTGLPVVSDFRVRDVAAAGQGAPLVPIADAMLFSGDVWRSLQNIGGIANVTVVPPLGEMRGIRAFDTGPGMMVIDAVAAQLSGGKLRMDADAVLSRGGTVLEEVLEELLADPYFAAEPPKTTGRERYGADYARRLIQLCNAGNHGKHGKHGKHGNRGKRGIADNTDSGDNGDNADNSDNVDNNGNADSADSARIANIAATAVELTARTIASAHDRFIPEPVTEVLISGGGARHPLLRERLEALLAPRKVRRFDDLYCDPEAKEALAFALLGWLHMEGRAGNVPAATGARGPRVLGKWTPA